MFVDKLNKMTVNTIYVFIFIFIFFISSIQTFAAPNSLGVEVVIQKPDNSYLQDPNVDFKFIVTDDSGACVIYSEDHNGVDMSGTNGQKTFQLGNTLLQTYPNPMMTTLTIDQVFSSSGVVYNCQGGGTYTSTSSVSRKVIMEFNDGSGLQSLPAMSINSVPYAVEAQKVVNNSITTQNILDGTITAADLSSMGAAAGQVMKWNGSAWVASNDNSGSGLVSSVAGRTGAVVLSSSDISGLGTLAGKNQIQLSMDVTGALPLANIAQSSATTGQVIKWNGLAWAVSDDSSSAGTVTSVNASSPLSSSGGATPNITIAQANGTASGYLSSADFTIFAAKLSDFSTLTSTDITGKLGYSPVNRAGDTMIGTLNLPSNGLGVGTNQLFVRGDNVGIGTTNPLYKLSIETANNEWGLSQTNGIVKVGSWIGVDPSVGTPSGWYGTETDHPLMFFTGNSWAQMTIATDGNVGIGTTSPSAKLTLASSDGTAGKAPLKLTAGTNLVTPEAGAIEFDGTNLYFTDSGTIRKTIATGAGGTVSGATGKIAKFTSAAAVGDSILSESGAIVTLSGVLALPASTSSVGQITIDGFSFMKAPLTNSNYSTFLGKNSGNITFTGNGRLVGIGENALSSNTTGDGNTAVGTDSLKFNTSGYSNASVGYRALTSNTTGADNTALGTHALSSNTTGNGNTAVGKGALSNITSGQSNIGIGYQALPQASSGFGNIVVGYNAMFAAVGLSSNNTVIGNNALNQVTIASNNIVIGANAAVTQADGSTALSTASSSIYIGTNSRGYSNSDNNSIVIGESAIGIGANSVVIGNDSITTTALKGNVGVGTTNPSAKLDVAGEVKFGNTSSTCNATNEGQQRYNSASKNMEFCNGTTWTAYGTGGSGGRTTCPVGITLIGTSGSAEAFCISSTQEASGTWLAATTACYNKSPSARLCSVGEWAMACVAGVSGPNNMTGHWEWVSVVSGYSGTGGGGEVMGFSGCDTFDIISVSNSNGARCCFR